MKITSVVSHILQYDLPNELGYSQQYYAKRTTHLVEIITDEGIVGWGECFGPGNVAIANKVIVEKVIQPMIIGEDPLNKEVIWHKVYNLLRDHGQKGMPIQALSGVDIALWDLAGKILNQPLYKLIGGKFRDKIPVYGYGMMLCRESFEDHIQRFKDESKKIKEMGFFAMKMKVGLGLKKDVKLAQTLRDSIGNDYPFMVDANHCYNTSDALHMGYALDELETFWFEEPVAPEDKQGYKTLRNKIKTRISGGEAEFTRWGWKDLLEKGCLDIAQPEVCALGGISEYLKVTTLADTYFTPVINHVWGSAIAVATNIHLLSNLAPMPGGMFQMEPMLEFDTTHNLFRDDLLEKPLNIQKQIKENKGYVGVSDAPGIGVEPNRKFIEKYELSL